MDSVGFWSPVLEDSSLDAPWAREEFCIVSNEKIRHAGLEIKANPYW